MEQVITLAETMQTKYFTQLQGLLNNYNEIMDYTIKIDNAKMNTLSYQSQVLDCRAKLQTLDTEHAYNADQLTLLTKNDSSEMCAENISYNTKRNEQQEKVKEYTRELDKWTQDVYRLSNQRNECFETIKETHESLNKSLVDFNQQLLVAANNYKQYKESLLTDGNETKLTPNTTKPIYSTSELARTKKISEAFFQSRPVQRERLSKQIEQDIPNNNNANTLNNTNNNSTTFSWAMDVD